MTQAPIRQQFAPLPVLGSFAPDAITLGRLVQRDHGITGKMRYGGEQNILIIGANGKGKGTRILMPNLLQMSGSSVVVVDPKGELAAVTAPFRRKLGRVVILNPFGVLTERAGYEDLASEGFNPLAALDPAADNFNSEAAALADALVTVGGNDPHWDESARALLAALIMYVVMEARGLVEEPHLIDKEEVPSTPTMARVRALLCQQSTEGRGNNPPRGLPALAEKMMKCGDAGLRNKASQFIELSREIQSIVSSAKRHTECFDDKPIREDLEKGTFDFRDLKREPITVYLILPPQMMARHSKWLRLVLTAGIQATLRAREHGEPKTLFMLDEFFALGHMEIISTVWALVRGYGVQIMPILQDTHQLKKLYPDMWETFVGMAGAVAAFAPNDMTTAEWMSKRAGEATRIQVGYNSGSSSSPGNDGIRNTSSNEGYTYSAVKAPLMPPHKLIGMQPGYMQVSLDGLANVALVYAPAYHEIDQCEERARDNPYYRPRRVGGG